MTPYPVKGSSLPIPFHRLMKVVVIANSAHPQLQQLLECLRAEHFELEVGDSYERDVTEDAAAGAYILLVDGDRLEPARRLARAVREAGFRTPLWALADAHRIGRHGGDHVDRRGGRIHLPGPAVGGVLRQAGASRASRITAPPCCRPSSAG